MIIAHKLAPLLAAEFGVSIHDIAITTNFKKGTTKVRYQGNPLNAAQKEKLKEFLDRVI